MIKLLSEQEVLAILKDNSTEQVQSKIDERYDAKITSALEKLKQDN